MTSPLDTLIREYADWNAAQGLKLGSADEHLFDDKLTHEERGWLADFCRRWDDAAEAERQRSEPVVSKDRLFIDDDYGSETYIRTIFCETFLGLRRAVRELNPGSIPIYSNYDCTGLVCGQSCKFIKIYRSGRGFIGVVEIHVTRDV